MSGNLISLPTARLVVAGPGGLLHDIVREVVLSERDLRLVEDIGDPDSLHAVLDQVPVDLVIWVVDGDTTADVEERCLRLLAEHPRLAVLTVEDDGRKGLLCQLRPHLTRLGELSPPLLLAVIRRAVRP